VREWHLQLDHNASVRAGTASPRGGIVRLPRRPEGWTAPGPRPPGSQPREDLWPAEGEDLCWLAGDWRILQRLDGHRWSADDLITAWYACRGPAPRRALDLGCGIGTVLLFTAWRFPEARCLGIEAQEVSANMARRSLAWNGVESRCRVENLDFREYHGESDFDLVTGTPPYFPPGSGLESDRVQRAPCRFEHRGGVEDYARVAAPLIAADGRFVACEAALQSVRVESAARAAGLTITGWLDVIPREGKPPLFCVFELRKQGVRRDETLTIRARDGSWTREFRALREAMGLPPALH
jgi:tRNA1(Val) A37 N6-methylase TrmN6